jgi:DNA-directed RNA polymerase delta subunit
MNNFIANLFKPKTPFLTDEEKKQLLDIKKKSYMEAAKILMEEKGKKLAFKELSEPVKPIKPVKEDNY